MAQYKWNRHAGTLVRLNAQTVGERLDVIKRSNGGLINSELVLADASSKSSPLHAAFEWEDQSAGKRYRLLQARQLISAVDVVQVEITKSPRKDITANVKVSKPKRPRAEPESAKVTTIQPAEKERASVDSSGLAAAIGEFQELVTRHWCHRKELGPLFQAVADARKRYCKSAA